MAICLAIGVRAQFRSNDEVLLYIPAGESIMSCKVPIIVRFNDNNLNFDMPVMSIIKDIYKNDSSLKSYFNRRHLTYKFDEDNTTSKRITYYINYNNTGTFHYLSFSPDKKSLIRWSDGTQPKYYIRVDLSELAPKSINKDFLYE